MNNNATGAGITWPDDRVFPLFQIPQHLDVYNLNTASHEDQFTVATLVGLINRAQPRVYLLMRGDDTFWLNAGLSSIPQDVSPLTQGDILHSLLTTYRSLVQGLIIYDPAMIDSVNVATTMAGLRDGIIVTPTQAQELQKDPYHLPILADLRVYKWTNRLQAYRWAKDNLLQGASPRLVAGLNPNITALVRPFLVATRAFVYWLDPLGILPNPTAGLLSERNLMQQILQHYKPGSGHFGWFIQEGAGVTLTSNSALPVFATDYFSNLEIWTSVQNVQPTMPAPQRSTRTPDPNKIYVSFTMSEGDNLQYIQERLLHLWQDPNRGTLPIGWPIPIVLPQAAPAMLDYYASSATPNDEFIAGPSGVGYMYPSLWPREQLATFLEHSGRLMQNMNLNVLEVLDSNFGQDINLMLRAIFKGSGIALIDKDLQKRYAEGLLPAGVRGILSGGGQKNASYTSYAGFPIYQNLGTASSIDEAVTMIKEGGDDYKGRPILLNLYVLAWNLTPSDLKQVVARLGNRYEIVTPGTLLSMLPAL